MLMLENNQTYVSRISLWGKEEESCYYHCKGIAYLSSLPTIKCQIYLPLNNVNLLEHQIFPYYL